MNVKGMSGFARCVVVAGLCLTLLWPRHTASAATLQQLSLDQMSQSATSIVRATVAGSSTSVIGATIYTHYKLQIRETWKGPAAPEVLLPGGIANGRRQVFPGVPDLKTGGEYVFFLWRSNSTGITHILGLSQGLFSVIPQANGSILASRARIGEMMLDAQGRKVVDHPVSMEITALKGQVRSPRPSTGAPN